MSENQRRGARQRRANLGTNSNTWVYGYDHRNQMTTVAFSATDGGAVTQRVTYVYDAPGNRIERDAWQSGGSATVERYGYDGWDPAKPNPVGNENFDAWADLDGANALTTRRVFGPGFDEVVARQTSGGVVSWYLADKLGSVRMLPMHLFCLRGTPGIAWVWTEAERRVVVLNWGDQRVESRGQGWREMP